jgi:hypothetical protein
MMVDLGAIAMQSALAREQRARAVGGGTGLAQRGTALRTWQAMPATWDEHHHYVIADL